MERLSDRQRLSRSEPNSQYVDPFAMTNNCDLIYDHRTPTALSHPPSTRQQDTDLFVARYAAPPQKLQPIRCHGRSPGENLHHTPHSDTAGDTVGTLESLPELGFSGKEQCTVGRGVSGDCFGSPNVARPTDTAESGGGGGGEKEAGRAGPSTGTEIRGSGSGLGSISDDDNLLSSSSDCDVDSAAQPVNRKRKRKYRKKFKVFLERLVAKVMEKQEQMHAQLIELIEKKDRERMIREEAWERQETERMKREEELRTQEVNRNMALIAFIRNVLGHDVEIPQPLSVLHPEEKRGKSGAETQVQRDTNCDLCNKRWPDCEVQALIMLRRSMEDRLRSQKANVVVPGSTKGSIWDDISTQMRNMGYNRSAKKCKEKWENINKYYRRLTESGKKHPENSKTCAYFQELDVLYKKGFMNNGNNAVVNPSCDWRETKT